MEEARQHTAVIAIYAFVLLFLIALLGALAILYIRSARHALQTGLAKGLLLGSNHYSRTEDPAIFWMIFCAGVIGAALGVIVLVWAILIIASVISAYFGRPTL